MKSLYKFIGSFIEPFIHLCAGIYLSTSTDFKNLQGWSIQSHRGICLSTLFFMFYVFYSIPPTARHNAVNVPLDLNHCVLYSTAFPGERTEKIYLMQILAAFSLNSLLT